MTAPIASPRLHRLIAGSAGSAPSARPPAPPRSATASGPVPVPPEAPGSAAGRPEAPGSAAGPREASAPSAGPPDATGSAAGPLSAASPVAGEERPQRCRLCAAAVPDAHRHLLDLSERELRCACQACAMLFDRPRAGGDRYRLVPDRRWHLPDFALDDAAWAGLSIPVDMAFFFHDTRAGRVACFYPSPAGAVESRLDLSEWLRLVRDNPVLEALRPDVEALLVDRSRGARDQWLVPIDDCYALVGLIRTHWTGLAGGSRVWTELAAYLGALRDRARTVSARAPVPARARHGKAAGQYGGERLAATAAGNRTGTGDAVTAVNGGTT